MHIDLDARSRDILHRVVDAYIQTGEPVGSKTIAQKMELSLSPATIRHVMADLVNAGLLYSPHTSAGRLPTEAGLGFFVNTLMEVNSISDNDKWAIESSCQQLSSRVDKDKQLENVTTVLSGLSNCAGLVIAPKIDHSLKYVEFVSIGPGRALVVMVTQDGAVENRVIDVPNGMPLSVLREATNYMNSWIQDRTLEQVKKLIEEDISLHRAQLNSLSEKVVQAGLATWTGLGGALIIRGHANLLKDVTQMSDIERLQELFSILEVRENLADLVDAAIAADDVQIFIGASSKYFQVSGCSLIVAPFMNGCNQIVGALGVVGPSRMNYGKIIPLVDYTAKMVTRLMQQTSSSVIE